MPHSHTLGSMGKGEEELSLLRSSDATSAPKDGVLLFHLLHKTTITTTTVLLLLPIILSKSIVSLLELRVPNSRTHTTPKYYLAFIQGACSASLCMFTQKEAPLHSKGLAPKEV